jgi:predicted CxxxxCH...CXXCH cytochrome family protein
MTVNWTRGNGSGVIVLMKAASAVNSDPVDGNYTGYTANAAFSSGTQIGTGNYVVFKGTGTNVPVTGLTDGTTYHVAVFEYAGTVDTSGVDQGTNYLLTPAMGNMLADTPADVTPPTVGTFTVTPISTTFTSGSPTITAPMTDAETAVTSCQYTVNNGATWAAGVVSGASSPYTCTANPTGLVGAVTINVRGTSVGGTGTGVAVNLTADAFAPVMSPPLIVAPGNAQNVISWSAASDTVSGVKQYDLRFVTGTTPPADCTAGTSIYTGSLLTYTHGTLTNGSDYSYRLCASDNANNVAAGITGSGAPVASGTATTLSAARTLVAATGNLADSTPNVLMEYLTLSAGTGGDAKVKLFSITMDDNAATATMYSAVKFYIDSTASTTLPATAVLLGGKARWDGTTNTFLLSGGSDTDRTITNGTPKYLYVVYDMAYGQTGKTALSRVTAVNVVTPDTNATGLALSSNTITLTTGTNLAVNTTCSDCHAYPPADSTGGRNVPASSMVGSHSAHNTNACSVCHVVPATTTSADFDHRTGNIQLLSAVTYSRGTNFPQTNDLTGAGLGTCATASCHGNVYGSGTVASPTWGTTAGCDACHSVAIGASGPATGSHTLAGHATACTACHNAGTTATTSPTVAHADGDIDIANVGYPANVAKHAAGSGYSTCTAASCHANVYGTGTSTTPVWGSTGSGCGACHSVTIDTTGPATGSHVAHNKTDCSLCHAGATNNTNIPTQNHINTTIEVTNTYSASPVAKHAAGSYTGKCSNASCHANVYGPGLVTTPTWGVASGCSACHSIAIGSTGPATGSHALAGHSTSVPCTTCHNAGTTSTTEPTTAHATGFIDVINVGYPANVTKHTSGSGYSTCSAASCHADPYSAASAVTPAWGSTGSGCSACHGAYPITATGPATGAHAKHMGLTGAVCIDCHNAGTTATVVPSSAHADGDIDVLGGYPLNYAKHAANAGYSTCTASLCHSSGQASDGTATPVYATSPNWGSTGTTCGSCHKNMDTDATAYGNHVKHAQTYAISCASCHNGYTETTVAAATHVNNLIETSFSGTLATGTTYSQANQAVGNGYGNCTTSYCHSSGQSTTGGATPTYVSATWGETAGCGSCHLDFKTSGSATANHVKHAQTYSIACASCHSGYTETTVATATHVNKLIETTFSGTLATGTTYSQANQAVGNNYGNCTTSYCHSTGQSTTGGVTPSYISATWGGTALNCGSCHLNFYSNASATGDHVKHAQGTANLSCATCHNGYTETTVNTATHVNKTIEVAITGTYAGGTYSGGTTSGDHAVGGGYGNCSATKCHGSGVPVWGGALYSTTVQCENCHGSAATSPFYSTAATGATPTKVTDETDSKVGAHFAHLTARAAYTNTISCGTCHSVPATVSTAGHMDGSATPAFSGTALLNSANPSYATSTCSNTYCHGAKMIGGSSNGTDTSPTWTQTTLITGTPSKTGDCAACHGCPPNTASHGSEALSACIGCHDHVNADGSFTSGANRGKHMDGIVQASGGDCLGCHSALVAADFVRPSRHVSNGTTTSIVTNFDCIVCHSEGDANSSGTTINRTTLHSGNSSGPVDLRNVDSATTGAGTANTNYWVWPGRRATPLAKGSANTSSRDNMDKFCMGCHDANGASTIAVNNSNNGLIVGAAAVSTIRTVTGTGNTNTNSANLAQRPFNTNDKLQNTRDTAITGSGTTIGTHRLTTYGRVLNVKSQFNSGNLDGISWASHHNLNQFVKRYTTNNTTAGTGLPTTVWTSYVTKENFTLNGTGAGTGANAGLHCSDCHLNEVNAHGSVNSWYMLNGSNTASDTDIAPTQGNSSTTAEISCFRCHTADQYAVGGAGGSSRTDHKARCNNIDVVTGTAVEAPFSNMCHGCHGGFGNSALAVNQDVVGTGSTLKGRGALGAIHGNNETYRPGGATADSPRYRFISGASMRFWNPSNTATANWTATSGGTCYTLSAADQWGSCTKHSGGTGQTINSGRALSY